MYVSMEVGIKWYKIPSSFFAGSYTILCRPSIDLTRLSSQVPRFRYKELDLIVESELLKLYTYMAQLTKASVSHSEPALPMVILRKQRPHIHFPATQT